MSRTAIPHAATRVPSRIGALDAPWSGTRLAPRVVHPVSFSHLPTATGPSSGGPMELRTPFDGTAIERTPAFDVDFSDLAPVRVPRPRPVSESR